MDFSPDRIRAWWYRLQNSLWFLPALITAISILLAFASLNVDRRFQLQDGPVSMLVFSGGVEGARGVLSAIAGTMMTVTALVFSITIVALQVAASQLTPRALRSIMADRGNQVVLGFFVATFTYALIVLRAVRSPLEDRSQFVPGLSVAVAIGLALISVALLIFFMHHSANALRTSVVIGRIFDETRGLIDSLYPDDVGEPAHDLPARPGMPYIVSADDPGYLQAIDADTLFALAERQRLTIDLAPTIGTFILPRSQIASVWSDGALSDDIASKIRGALSLGSERTMQSDVDFGLQQLADIGLRALSPGVNDPTTAVVVVDHLAALVIQLANRGQPETVREGDDEAVRLILRAPSFNALVATAFEQISHYGADNPTFARHLTSTLEHAAALVPPSSRPQLLRFAEPVGAQAGER
ncbi:MAG: Protein of unknown function rane [Thermomicrobiales bacterium]|nr:Protein of unknown function rane [Thermomicrobiales bacterium]